MLGYREHIFMKLYQFHYVMLFQSKKQNILRNLMI